ncbi:MAG: GAF domain-containing protein [Terriglobales bacterium]
MVNLSPYQVKIGKLVGQGFTNRRVAKHLGISEQAVKSALHVIFDKLDIGNRVELTNLFHASERPSEVSLLPSSSEREGCKTPKKVIAFSPSSSSLARVLVTYKLHARRPNPCRYAEQRQALEALGATLGKSRDSTLRALSDLALTVCQAGTAGVSILCSDGKGGEHFRWAALSGVYRDHVGGTTPRDFSPCGTTLDRGSPQLFAYPGRCFPYFNAVQPPIVEALVIPIVYGRVALGTLWIVSHDDTCYFTLTESEVMQSMVALVAAALAIHPGRDERETYTARRASAL